MAQENRTHHLTVTYFFSYRRLRHTIEVSNKPRFIKRNNKPRKWRPHSAFASRHGMMGAHHWVLNVRQPHLGFIICQARKGLVPTINYVQPPLTSIMQRYRSSILFSNKQMFDQQSGRQRNIIAARKRKSPAPEWKPFLAQKKKKKPYYCLAVKGAPRAQSSRVEIGAHFNETKMLIFINLFLLCWLQKAEESRNQ